MSATVDAAADATAQREAVERMLDAAHRTGDFEGAATTLLQEWGGEIGGFLAATLRDPDDAADAFSQFQEDLWRGLEHFDRRSSFRTWAYVIARHAAFRVRRPAYRRRERPHEIRDSAFGEKLVAQVRTATAGFLKTETKDRVRALRAELSANERALLILRIDRGLDWHDIALIFPRDDDDMAENAGDAPSPDSANSISSADKKRAATLRKRFERIKDKLRALATEHGLL